MSEIPNTKERKTKAPKGDSGSGGTADKRVIDSVVAELKPLMEDSIARKFEGLREDIKALRAEIKPQPSIDISGLGKEIEKILPGAGSMLQGTVAQASQSAPPMGLPDKTPDGLGVDWGPESHKQAPAQPAAVQPQNGFNLPMILQLLNTPVVQQMLGLGSNTQAAQNALLAMQQFSQLAMQNAMADMQFGSMVRKSAMQSFVKQNPMLGADVAQAMQAENALIGKPIAGITSPPNPEGNTQ